MTTTTATTTTYALIYYRYQRDSPGNIRQNVPKSEWRVYATNANSHLRLVITQMRDSRGSFVNLNLRVIDGEETRPGGIIALEELDLVEFSKPGVNHSSPIKAVHGGKQLGFRYIQPLNGSRLNQYFKRFQLTFCTDADCQSVVSMIQLICPVSSNETARKNVTSNVPSNMTEGPREKKRKLEETNGSANAHSATSVPASTSPMVAGQDIVASTSRQTQQRLGWKDALLSTQRTAELDSGIYTPSQPPTWWPGNLLNAPGNPMPITTPTLLAQAIPPISQPHSSQSQLPSNMQAFSSSQLPPTTQPLSTQTQQGPSSHQSNLPTPSFRGTTTQRAQQSSLGPPSETLLAQVGSILHANGLSASAGLSTPPGEATNLNALSPDELEKAVIQVINEPGFVDLMEKLEKMYALRGFVHENS